MGITEILSIIIVLAIIAGVISIIVKIISSAKEKIKNKMAAKRKEQEEQERNKLRSELEARATAGDETAERELREMGITISDSFRYFNFDFDPEAINRVYNLIGLAMFGKGFPAFPEEKVTEERQGTGNFRSTISIYEGKTPRGDTLNIRYRIGPNVSGSVEYKLYLKALRGEGADIEKTVYTAMKAFLSTVPEWTGDDKPAVTAGYSSNAVVSNDSITEKKSGEIKVYKGSGGYDVAYTISGNNIYANSLGYGDVAYRIDGNNIYKGSASYDVAYRIDGNNIYKGGGGYDVAYRIDGNTIYNGGGGYDVAYRIEKK